MNIWNKFLTALRGVANETSEAIIDTQAIRIMEQEIRDAKDHLDNAKEVCAEIVKDNLWNHK